MRARMMVERSGRTRRMAALAGVALVLAACSGTPSGSGSVGTNAAGASTAIASQAIPALANVSLDPGHVASQVIGPAGGVVEATDAKGAIYRLSIPVGALARDTAISAVPITAVARLPKEAEVAGGVHFLPEGLTFWAPATLLITLASTPAAGVVPFAYAGDLSEPHRYPALVEGGTVQIEIFHFSGYALLTATRAAQLITEFNLVVPWEPPAGPADLALSVIAGLVDATTQVAHERSIVGINNAMTTWLETGIRPLVSEFRALGTWSEAGAWQTKGDEVRGSLLLWDYLEKLFLLQGIPLDASLSTQFKPLAISATTHALSVTNVGCSSAPANLILLRLIDEFRWQALATEIDIAREDDSLTLPFVEEHLCVKVVYDPNGGTDFPSGMRAGQTGTLAIHVGVAVDGSQPVFLWYLDVTVTPHGAEPDSVVHGETNESGTFSHQFRWAQGAPEIRLDIKACIPLISAEVCQDAFVVRGRSAGPSGSAPAPTGPAAGFGLRPLISGVVGGGTVQFAADTAEAVSWSATGGSITAAGLYTAGASTGLFTVTARSTSSQAIVGFAQITNWSGYQGGSSRAGVWQGTLTRPFSNSPESTTLIGAVFAPLQIFGQLGLAAGGAFPACQGGGLWQLAMSPDGTSFKSIGLACPGSTFKPDPLGRTLSGRLQGRKIVFEDFCPGSADDCRLHPESILRLRLTLDWLPQ